MTEKKNPKISACMIVKNEEQLLPRCLRSIRDHVDEIIVVDTGSTDRTVEIAKGFDAKVYHHPWEAHFSKHRNQSMDYATGDWLFIVDADEELLSVDGDSLQGHLDLQESFDSVMIRVECASPTGVIKNNSIRFIRNHRGIRYQGRVHNYLMGLKKTYFLPIRLYHHGYNLGEDVDRKKFERTTSLLKLDVADDPDNARPYHFLAASYLSSKRFKEAADYAKKALVRYEKNQMVIHNYLWCLYMASASHFYLGETEKATCYAKKGTSLFEDHLDSHYMLAMIAVREKKRPIFDVHRGKYYEIKGSIEASPEAFGEIVHNTLGSAWVLDVNRGFFLMDEGLEQQADGALKNALEQCPDASAYYLMLGQIFQNRKDFSLAETHYKKALEYRPASVEALWALAGLCEQLNRPEKQVSCLENIMSLKPNVPLVRYQLGLACMQKGSFQQALAHFKAVQKAEPENTRAKINETLCLRGIGRHEEALERSLSIKTQEREETLTLIGNVAHTYEAMGQTAPAIAWFEKMADIEPADVLPPVHLSRLYLDVKQIESCISQCDRLLSLLGLENDRVLNSVGELGELFHDVGNRLQARNRHDLGEICFQVAQKLEKIPSESMGRVP
jgi:tetratricopeptide (TPR) repeat protein